VGENLKKLDGTVIS